MTARHNSNSQNSIISFDYSWFLAKKLSNFVSLPWKLHNQYCHNLHLCKYCTWAATLIALPALSGAYLISLMTHKVCNYFEIWRQDKLFAQVNADEFPLVQVQIKICNSIFRLCNSMVKSFLKEYLPFKKDVFVT